MVGHMPVQSLLLKARVLFTQAVDSAFARDRIFEVQETIERARSAVITELSKQQTSDDRAALMALQAVLQEQQHTSTCLASMSQADAIFAWDSEMRFYRKVGGSF